MNRREVIGNIGVGSAMAFLSSSLAVTESKGAQPLTGVSRLVAMSQGIYGTPMWSGEERVRGTLVLFGTKVLGLSKYWVSLAPEYRRGNNPWAVIPPVNDHRGIHYKSPSHGGVRDVFLASTNDLELTLFVPDEVLFLREGPVSVRFVIRLYDESNTELREYTTAMPERDFHIVHKARKRVLQYQGGSGPLNIEVYDRAANRYLSLQ